MFGVSILECMTLAGAVVSTVILVWLSWRISVKAGFPGPLGLVSLIPGGVLGLLFVWALLPWPVLRSSTAGREPSHS
jgi:hypothetical protein